MLYMQVDSVGLVCLKRKNTLLNGCMIWNLIDMTHPCVYANTYHLQYMLWSHQGEWLHILATILDHPMFLGPVFNCANAKSLRATNKVKSTAKS